MKSGNGLSVYETEGARLGFLLASLRLDEGNIDVAINQAETAIKILKELQKKKREEMQNGKS